MSRAQLVLIEWAKAQKIEALKEKEIEAQKFADTLKVWTRN
jgi:hypothetical protein